MDPAFAARLDLIFGALADPTRRAILQALLEGERRVGDLAAPFVLSLAAVSKHVQILARAGLVSQLRCGRARTCRIEPDGLREAEIWMRGFGTCDPQDYDALEELIASVLSPHPDADSSDDRGDHPLGARQID